MQHTPLDIVGITVYSVIGICGITGNAVLLAAIKLRSPSAWKSYTILLTNCALIDLLACISSTLSMERFVPFKDVTTSVYLGPCGFISGFFCHILHSILVHTLTQSLFFICFAFCYRLYVIGRCFPGKTAYKSRTKRLSVRRKNREYKAYTKYTFDSPSVSRYFHAHIFRAVDNVRAALQTYHPDHEQFAEYVIEGHVDLQPRLLSIFVQIYVLTPIVPLCIFVFAVRRKVIRKLHSSAEKMSERTQRMHNTLVNILTLQASLPITFVFSLVSILMVKRKIYDSPFLEHSIFWYISSMPAAAPFITLYNVAPYRDFVLGRAIKVSMAVTNGKQESS